MPTKHDVRRAVETLDERVFALFRGPGAAKSKPRCEDLSTGEFVILEEDAPQPRLERRLTEPESPAAAGKLEETVRRQNPLTREADAPLALNRANAEAAISRSDMLSDWIDAEPEAQDGAERQAVEVAPPSTSLAKP